MRILCRPNEDFEGLSGAMDPIMRVGPDVAATVGTGQPRRQAVVRYESELAKTAYTVLSSLSLKFE